MEMPQCFSSASKAARPFAMFSSFFSFLNHWRILLRASLDSGNLHPVPAGALGVFGGENLHDVAVFQHMVQGDDPAVDLGAHHPVAHGGVNGVGKVDGGGAGGQVLHVAARCEDEDLIGEHIDLQRVDIVLCVRALLVFQQTADPLVASLRCRRPGRSACISSGRPRRTRRSRASPWCGSAPRRAGRPPR